MSLRKDEQALEPVDAALEEPRNAPRKPDLWTVAKGIKAAEFKLENVAKVPCSRKALLYGIGGGTIIATTRFFVTRRLLSAGNWGFASFGAISMLSWEFCRYQRRVVQEQLEAMAAETAKRTEGEKRGRPSANE
ncbi:uncharacterized protein SPPG_02636 [Spizellomyces punctatus DAOM BR117]|uniref:Cytochrome c oxidase assembly protein COX20, mitochondrial n=1 Tax=Spizellomyces punctatus (strain DAOM BR117) TaxID=645134 RepID=A0A0L0HM63_SPIPD|nr:uncharacterized protein SPPG_02636 [Spizellomyces punctatus DAOM BR117]KND02143.1 hypothetical protein SPPG_02636 [Spizellomyces punctatus DAOM BR117]|eukprot:XP_016610182.1 hypothetical protein SPPG_02636 [Spizellomyces punctatus DAOM BR117]